MSGCVFAGLLAGCDPSPPEGGIEALRTAPLEVAVEGQPLALEAFLWRDGSVHVVIISLLEGGRLLNAILRVKSANGTPLPPQLSVRGAFFVLNQKLWATFPRGQMPATPTDMLVVEAYDGPQWNPEATVDVVVQLSVGSSEPVLLRVAGVQIVLLG